MYCPQCKRPVAKTRIQQSKLDYCDPTDKWQCAAYAHAFQRGFEKGLKAGFNAGVEGLDWSDAAKALEKL